MAEHTHENYAKIAKSCGLTMYPDPGGERYVFFMDGKVAGKKSECCDEMIEELWNAVIRLRERLDETEASHDDEEAAHSETLAMLERLRTENVELRYALQMDADLVEKEDTDNG